MTGPAWSRPPATFRLSRREHPAVTASSILNGRSRYRPGRVLDGRLETAWSEGVAGSGSGEWLLVTLPRRVRVRAVGIAPGYQKQEERLDRFVANNRPTSARLRFDAGERRIELRDERGIQRIPLDSPVETRTVRIAIEGVARGRRWDDTMISEVDVDYEGRPTVLADEELRRRLGGSTLESDEGDRMTFGVDGSARGVWGDGSGAWSGTFTVQDAVLNLRATSGRTTWLSEYRGLRVGEGVLDYDTRVDRCEGRTDACASTFAGGRYGDWTLEVSGGGLLARVGDRRWTCLPAYGGRFECLVPDPYWLEVSPGPVHGPGGRPAARVTCCRGANVLLTDDGTAMVDFQDCPVLDGILRADRYPRR